MMDGRDGRIWTADPTHPKRVRYQAAPRPDRKATYYSKLPPEYKPELFIKIVDFYDVKAQKNQTSTIFTLRASQSYCIDFVATHSW